MRKCRVGLHRVYHAVPLGVTLLVLLGLLIHNVTGSVYISLLMEPFTAIATPPVILQNGTAGTSTIYTNSTSAKVSVASIRANETEDYVDVLSNVDSSVDTGTHSNFTAQQYGPDSIYDILTEQDTGTLIIRPNAAGTKTDWNPVGSTNNWECVDEVTTDEDTTFVNTTSKNKKDFYNLQDHTTETGSISNVRLFVRAKGNAGAEITPTLKTGGVEYPGQAHILTTSYADYYEDWATNPAGGNWTWSDMDALEAGFRSSTAAVVEHRVTQLYLNVTYGPNYKLDLEVQWTNVDYDEPNEELCIYCGTMGAENITVDVWNGTAWNEVFTDLSSGWNNVSVSSYLTSSNFTVRFKGGNEVGDASQDSWNIDATLLYVFTSVETTYDYVLRVNNTVTNSWEVRLKKYANASIGRLQNCTIYFRNATNANSTQIVIENGSFNQTEGPWYNLDNSETICMAITVEANSTGTSYVYTYLEIRTPNTTTYAQYVITFKIT